jgi:hypothetical protein
MIGSLGWWFIGVVIMVLGVIVNPPKTTREAQSTLTFAIAIWMLGIVIIVTLWKESLQ